MDPKTSRGYRNRNPGNLNYIPRGGWRGQIGMEPARPGMTPRFGLYDSHENGIRAIVCQLRRYQERGKVTLRQMISTWAPPSDNNDTAAYWGALSRKTGIAVDSHFPMDNRLALTKLVTAIIEQECGGNPYTPEIIAAGIDAADEPGQTIKDAAKTESGVTAVQIGAVTGAAAAAAPAVQALGGLHPVVAGMIVVAVIAAAVAFFINRKKTK